MTASPRTRLALAAACVTTALVLPAAAAAALPPPGYDPELPPTTRRVTTSTTARVVDANARWVVQADWMFCNDETGEWDWTGSDEARWDFVSTDGTGNQFVWAKSFGDVDTGESRFFGPRDLTAPTAGPVTLSASLREMDDGTPNELLGEKTVSWTPAQLDGIASTPGSVGTQTWTFSGVDASTYTLHLRVVRTA
jgi:hypothetical protein